VLEIKARLCRYLKLELGVTGRFLNNKQPARLVLILNLCVIEAVRHEHLQILYLIEKASVLQ
jgi:hypothetical protein